MSHRLSFTEKRRARLRKAVDRIERLEPRNTITEPISITALSVTALGSLARLGIVQIHGGGGALKMLQAASEAARHRGNKTDGAAVLPLPSASSFVPVAVGSRANEAVAGGSERSPQAAAATGLGTDGASHGGDWLDLSPAAGQSTESGISSRWQPPKAPAGGATRPPRGGSGSAIQPYVVAAMRAQTGHAQPAQPAAAPAALPGVYLPSPPASNGGGAAAPAATHNARTQRSAAPAQASTFSPAATPSSTPSTPVIIQENPSSLPSSTAGNRSLQAMGQFTYFPLYTLDYDDGTVFFPNTYQLATLGGNVDLRAQTSGTTGVTYSWNTSNLTPVSSVSGTSTYDLTFKWGTSNVTGPSVASVTLTATNASNQQESQTYYWLVPEGSFGAGGTTPTWPSSLSPDTISVNSPSWASDDVSVAADTGALDTTISLPSYNPNVPALALTYDSLTANPLPIIVVEHPIDPTQAVPSEVSAQLTFDGTAGTTWYYNTSEFTPGDIQQIALQANATSLSTGRYSYSAQVIDLRSGVPTTFTYSGSATVINSSTSPFGDGWTLQGLEQITSASGGVILNLGEGGESLWFTGSFGSGGGTYTSPAGEFSSLVLNSNGTYTRTLPDGTQIDFNSSGYEIATVDLNNNHATYPYNGSNQLTSIEDPYGNFTTFSYSGGYVQTIQDPAGRRTTFTFSGSSLEAVQEADSSRVTFTYDSSGRLTEYEDARSNVVTITYDSAERVGTITRPDLTTQEFSADEEQGWTNTGTSGSPAPATLLAASASTYTDPNGNTSAVRPDWWGLGVVGQTTDALGDVVTNDVSSSGLPTVTIDALNRITQDTYDSQGSPATITLADGNTEHYSYNSDAEPLTYTNADGHTTSYTYDSHGNLTVVEDPLGNLTTMTYTTTGQVQTETDADNYTTTYQYDSQERLTTVLFADSASNLYAYNSQGDVVKFTDGRGNSTTYSYDAMNRETGMTDALNDVATYTYDGNGNLTVDQEPTAAGQTARTTTYAYDSLNRLTTTTSPLGYETVYGYDADGNQISVKDPMGRITTTVFDALDRPVVVIDPMGNRTTTTFDADGETLTVTDALSRTTTYTYSVRGWVATETDPMGNVVTYTYSATGMQLGQYQTQGSGVISQSNSYDADDRLTTVTDALGDTTVYHYDGVGNQTSVTDPNSNIVTQVYDSMNRVIEVIQPLGVTVSYTYDGSGNQQTVTDALGHTTTTLYDALDRATTIISAVGGTTTIAYDAASREISLTDPDGNKTQWAYDADDRVTTMTEPNGSTLTYVYDDDNELIDTTDEDGRRTTYSYNADGDQTGETWVGASPSEKITYTYDADNELTGAADSYATLTFTYDNDGWLASAGTSGPGAGQPTVTLTYGYDQLGDETSVRDNLSSQGITSYTYDSDQHMELITTSYGGTAGPEISFAYDSGGRLTGVSRWVGSASNDLVNTTISYDAANRVVTITDGSAVEQYYPPGWTTTPLATCVYSYDDANRVTTMVDAEGTYTYTYDNANELTSVYENGTQVGSYSYDSNGNRNSSGYTTGTENEMTASPGYTYTYDNAGNMISATNTSTHVTTTYTYDYRNRLTEVETGGTVVATYTYDALNRRIGADDNGTQTWTVYDGKSPDAEPYADFNGSGSLTVRYVHGPTVVNGAVTTGILARTSSGGTTAWYLTDNLGSVRDIVSPSGTELDHIVYDSFGNIVTETDAANGDRFKFAGMQYDATTGQYFDDARWYGAGQGRFLNQDPLGFRAGDPNLYRYVANGVINATDPSGTVVAVTGTLTITTLVAGMVESVSAALLFTAAGSAAIAAEVVAVGYLGNQAHEYYLQEMAWVASSEAISAQIRMVQMQSAMNKMIDVMVGVGLLASEIDTKRMYNYIKSINEAKSYLANGQWPDGSPLTDEDVANILACIEAWYTYLRSIGFPVGFDS